MTATFETLLSEVREYKANLLADSQVKLAYGGEARRLTVQRSDGAIWEAWDGGWAGLLNDEAQPWSLPQMEYAYLHAAKLGLGNALDGEALWHCIEWLRGSDEHAAAVEMADWLLEEARR